MQFASTRNPLHRVGFSEALLQGLAPDGGLYVPAPGQWPPAVSVPQMPSSADGSGSGSELASLAAQVLAPFAAGDALAPGLDAMAREAFDFPAPLVWLQDGTPLGVLELFHGPTAAFKDFGARFLAAGLSRRLHASRPLKILVATSGDTGGAVAAAFHRRPGMEVAVLFPRGLVSPTQERQLTCWGDNVASFSVRGSFDDCQRLVKQALVDAELGARVQLSSANSINLGRLLPQTVYYFSASLQMLRTQGKPASFVIPSGNLGNATACVWAKRLGAPIDAIVLAHNANRTLPDYLSEGVLRPRASVPTVASAMDVGNPSNLERLSALYPDALTLGNAVSASWVDDASIRERIRSDFNRLGRIWCPHTAAAAEVHARLPAALRARGPWVLVATADPAKFREVVEPLIGREVPVPPNLKRLFERPSQYREIEPQYAELKRSI